MPFRIRAAQPTDLPELLELWNAAGLVFDAEAAPREFAGVLRQNPELVLVAEEEDAGELLGSIVGTFDGRRGWVNRLATAPAHRGAGVAGALLKEFEDRVLATGGRKVNLLIEPSNAGVVSFYLQRGYTTDELIFMEHPLSTGANTESPESAEE